MVLHRIRGVQIATGGDWRVPKNLLACVALRARRLSLLGRHDRSATWAAIRFSGIGARIDRSGNVHGGLPRTIQAQPSRSSQPAFGRSA